MRRRAFIALVGSAVIGWPIFGRAQQASKIYRLGYLAPGRIPLAIEILQADLRELGYVEGRNLEVEYRFGRNLETLDVLAAELVAHGPDAIVTVGTPAALAAKRATTTIPIVMASLGDPLRAGIVASLAHPGGNITGTSQYASELSDKRVELLTEAVSGIARLAVLGNATNLVNEYLWEDTRLAAQALGMEPRLFTVRERTELPEALAAMQQSGVNAVIVLPDNLFWTERHQIIALAAEHRLPAMYEAQVFVAGGGLTSYGPNIAELIRGAAVLVDKVLKGTKPADLPIEQPTKFELVINLKTAKALGLTIPPSLLARADEVIE
jgi:putative ABC transport system substrate-binding protein